MIVLKFLLQQMQATDVKLPLWVTVVIALGTLAISFWKEIKSLFESSQKNRATIQLKELELQDKLDEAEKKSIIQELKRANEEINRYKENKKKDQELIRDLQIRIQKQEIRSREQDIALNSIRDSFEIMYHTLKKRLPEDAELLLIIKKIADNGLT